MFSGHHVVFFKIKRKHSVGPVIANVPRPSFQLRLWWPLLEGILPVRTVCCSSSRCCSPGAFCLNLKVWTSLHFLSLAYARRNAPRRVGSRLKNLPLPHSGRELDLRVHGAEWIQIHSVQQKSTTNHYGPGFGLDKHANETYFQLLGPQNPRGDIYGTYACWFWCTLPM